MSLTETLSRVCFSSLLALTAPTRDDSRRLTGCGSRIGGRKIRNTRNNNCLITVISPKKIAKKLYVNRLCFKYKCVMSSQLRLATADVDGSDAI